MMLRTKCRSLEQRGEKQYSYDRINEAKAGLVLLWLNSHPGVQLPYWGRGNLVYYLKLKINLDRHL